MRLQTFLIFILLFSINGAAQEIVGLDRTMPGTLASFEIVPAQEASWHIVTPSLDEPYLIDSNTSKLYFASPEQGRYTIIAGLTVEGKPKLLVKTFVNGEENKKPMPVSTLESWIKTQLPILAKSSNLVSESRLVAECFEQIVQRIDAGNIKTVQNAQAQLQVALTASLALDSPTAVTNWTPFLEGLSRQLENELLGKNDDIIEVRKILLSVSDVLKSFELPRSVQRPNRLLFRPVFAR
jgi:hypothetical protein